MDYEKLHKDTITKLQEMVNSGKITAEIARGICADFVPEGEDERIREAIIKILHYTFSKDSVLFDVSREDMIAWLEKQGKNNMGISEATKKKLEDNLNEALEKETPESWNDFLDEQDYQPVNTDYISGIRVGLLSIEGNAKNINGLTESQWVAIRAANRLLAEYIEKVQQKPWSEEDEKIINKLIAVVELYYGIGDDLDKQRCLSWLNSLKDRYTWKPTKEQLTELRCVISGCGYVIEPLVELENELKAL